MFVMGAVIYHQPFLQVQKVEGKKAVFFLFNPTANAFLWCSIGLSLPLST